MGYIGNGIQSLGMDKKMEAVMLGLRLSATQVGWGGVNTWKLQQ